MRRKPKDTYRTHFSAPTIEEAAYLFIREYMGSYQMNFAEVCRLSGVRMDSCIKWMDRHGTLPLNAVNMPTVLQKKCGFNTSKITVSISKPPKPKIKGIIVLPRIPVPVYHHPLWKPTDPPENSFMFIVRFNGCRTYEEYQVLLHNSDNEAIALTRQYI